MPTFEGNAEGGVVLVTSSIAGRTIGGSSMAYSVTKAAQLHLVKCVAKTQGSKVRCNAVLPGLLLTEWGLEYGEERIEELRQAAVLKREVSLGGFFLMAFAFASAVFRWCFFSGMNLLLTMFDFSRHHRQISRTVRICSFRWLRTRVLRVSTSKSIPVSPFSTSKGRLHYGENEGFEARRRFSDWGLEVTKPSERLLMVSGRIACEMESVISLNNQ